MLIALLLAAQDIENDPRFHPLLLEAAKNHGAYGQVDSGGRFAPTLCAPPPTKPVRFSGSKDEATHGRKLYFLYAWDAQSYLNEKRPDYNKTTRRPPVHEGKPAEQALIKQSWEAVPAEKETDPDARGVARRFTRKDGKLFTTGAQKELFLMVKLAEGVEGTDRGWVYGTATPDGKTVTSSGRVKTCMACHETAGAGRLFGLPKDP